jgi:beta-galactoside alpha-2,3-sialyltransferase (sialyltransferase 4A)
MTEDMGFEVVRRRVPSAAVLVAVLVLVPQPAAAQGQSSDGSREGGNLETSIRGSLQHRLAMEYPDAFREGVDIFWEPRDGWVSEEVLSWWLSRLAPEDHGGVTQEAAERMFSRLSGQAPVFPAPPKRAICAVVGPSRNLLESRYADQIDAHDLVIRINRAPTDNFDSDVGIRTTHHVMWPRDLEDGQFDRQAILMMTPLATDTRGVFDRILDLVEDDLQWDLDRVRIIHPAFVKYLHEYWTKERRHYPSTGFIALMMALHVCDEVDVFGFGADASGRWDRYYEDDPVDVSGFHPGDYEGQLRREMEEKGILKVFRGSRRDPELQHGSSSSGLRRAGEGIK